MGNVRRQEKYGGLLKREFTDRFVEKPTYKRGKENGLCGQKVVWGGTKKNRAEPNE